MDTLYTGDQLDSEFFRIDEFRCPCCGRAVVSQALLDCLESARRAFGPIKVLSGYRCPVRNLEKHGVPRSWHTLGLAADVVALRAGVSVRDLYDFMCHLRATGACRYVEKYAWGVHVDVGRE